MKKLVIVLLFVLLTLSGCSTVSIETSTLKAKYTRIGNTEVDGFDAFVDNDGVPHLLFNSARSKRDKELYGLVGDITEAAVQAAIKSKGL